MTEFHTIEQAEMKEEPEPDFSGEEGFEVIYHEYDCGRPCTENGCPGHETTMPVGFWLDGITFWVEGAEGGDFPSGHRSVNDQVAKVIEKLTSLLKKP